MRIWGCERFSVPSKPVCGMTLQNIVSIEVFIALKFRSRPLFGFKKIANYLIPQFCNRGVLPYFSFLWGGGGREMELELLWAMGQVYSFILCIFTV